MLFLQKVTTLVKWFRQNLDDTIMWQPFQVIFVKILFGWSGQNYQVAEIWRDINKFWPGGVSGDPNFLLQFSWCFRSLATMKKYHTILLLLIFESQYSCNFQTIIASQERNFVLVSSSRTSFWFFACKIRIGRGSLRKLLSSSFCRNVNHGPVGQTGHCIPKSWALQMCQVSWPSTPCRSLSINIFHRNLSVIIDVQRQSHGYFCLYETVFATTTPK